jgi:hypothetical protein
MNVILHLKQKAKEYSQKTLTQAKAHAQAAALKKMFVRSDKDYCLGLDKIRVSDLHRAVYCNRLHIVKEILEKVHTHNSDQNEIDAILNPRGSDLNAYQLAIFLHTHYSDKLFALQSTKPHLHERIAEYTNEAADYVNIIELLAPHYSESSKKMPLWFEQQLNSLNRLWLSSFN